jgi:hypothetical protein
MAKCSLSLLFARVITILLAADRFRSSVSLILLRVVLVEPGKFGAILACIAVTKGFSLRKLTNNASSLPCDTFFLPLPCFLLMVLVSSNLRFANNTVFLSTYVTPSLSLVMTTHFCKLDNCGISNVTHDSDLLVICQKLTLTLQFLMKTPFALIKFRNLYRVFKSFLSEISTAATVHILQI